MPTRAELLQRRLTLSPAKRTLLEQRKHYASSALKETSLAIPKRLKQESAPLSFAQQRLWFLQELQPTNPAYNEAMAVRLQGRLEVDILGRVVEEISSRHEILRCTFPLRDKQVCQVVHEAWQASMQHLDLSDIDTDVREDEVHAHISAEICHPFQLASEIPWRLLLLKLSEEEHIFLVVIHHILADAWSLEIFIKELVTLYSAYHMKQPSPLAPLPIQYADYAEWQHQEDEHIHRQLAYWRERLSDIPPVLELPSYAPRPAVQTYKGSRYKIDVPDTLYCALQTLSRQENATLFMTLFSTFTILLHRYTSKDDILVGTPIAGRGYPELEGLLGCFVNTLVLRTDLSGNPSFRKLLRQVSRTALEAYENSDVPFEKLVDELQITRDLSHSPLFQVMFSLQNVPSSVRQLPSLKLTPIEIENGTTKFELSLILEETEQELSGYFEYNTDLFDALTIERMCSHYISLLESAVAQPDGLIDAMSLLTKSELHQMLIEWNNVTPSHKQEDSLLSLLARQVAYTPDAIAVVHEGQQLTYRELYARSHMLACYLRTLDMHPETLIAVMTERNPMLLIAMLAIFMSGCTYLPLDPFYPHERLLQILVSSKSYFVLTTRDFSAMIDTLSMNMPEEAQFDVFYVDDMLTREIEVDGTEIPLPVKIPESQLMYVIYTSGSTGIPKGVMIEHCGMLNHLYAKIATLQLTATDVVAQTASHCFDISIWQFLAPLLVGGSVHIIPDWLAREPIALLSYIGRQRISIVEIVPSLLRAALDVVENEGVETPQLPSALSTLRWLISTGEPLQADLCDRWLRYFPAIPLLNAYGPTECSDDVSHAVIQHATGHPGSHVSVGSPITNTQMYVLDQRLQPVPPGVIGELYVGGYGVGRGYVGAPRQTAEVFLPNPFSIEPGARLYKTGDIACHFFDGTLKLLGRVDAQLKIRGFRIEPGEVENVLLQHSLVKAAVVVTRKSASDDVFLVAYVVLAGEAVLLSSDLQHFLKGKLPEYMVPSIFMMLETLPLTPNGKIDYKALPAIYVLPAEGRAGNARNPIEEVLVAIWSVILQVEHPSIFDDFFLLGGHSLLATAVIARVRKAFQIEITLLAFLEKPTIADLAEHIKNVLQMQQGATMPPLLPVPRTETMPLSFTQQRLWFLEQLGFARYNTFGAVHLTGVLHIQVLERCFDEMLRRHETLRTSFVSSQGQLVQVIKPQQFIKIALRKLPSKNDENAIKQFIQEEKEHSFDLERDTLLRVTLLELAEEEHILLLTSHQIVFDGWSTQIFLHELALLYTAFINGHPSPLAALPVQYVDYVAWQRTWLEEKALETHLAYWRQQLANLPQLSLPIDHLRPTHPTAQGAIKPLRLSKRLTLALKQCSRREGVTLFMLLLAAFQMLLSRYADQCDIVVGTPVANRNCVELEGLIGAFLNTLVLRTDFSGNPTFREVLARVRKMALDAYTHQNLPFERLVTELQPERGLNRNPLFQVLFALQNVPQNSVELPGLTSNLLTLDDEVMTFDLDLSLWEQDDELVGGLKYSVELFEPQTIERMCDDLLTLLESIVIDTTQHISELSLHGYEQQRQLLIEWNATSREFARHLCIHELFEAQVKRTPEALAVLYEEQTLSYRELNGQANRIARHLKKIGVGPNSFVAVFMERTPEMISALLGILKAGAAYVPLETTFPFARSSWILSSLQVSVLITQRSHMSEAYSFAQQIGSMDILCLNLDTSELISSQEAQYRVWTREHLAHFSGENLPAQCSSSDLAYTIFTSGSTGTPKGVMVRHISVVNLIEWVNATFKISSLDRILFTTSLCFDLSVYDIFGLLAAGGTIQIASIYDLREPERLLQSICEHPITFWDSAPAALQQLVPFLPFFSSQLKDSKLRLVFLSGDWIPVKLPGILRDAFHAVEVISLGGATEATVWSNYYRIREVEKRWNSIPYGRPIWNAQYYILDAYLNPCPIGVSGDLYIGGDCLALGYANEPALTAQKFIPDPFSPQNGERLYKTGDLARFWPDGTIEFLGRQDTQVKIRGFRIELGEIEAAIVKHPSVQVAIVEAQLDTMQEKRLVAYVVPLHQHTISSDELRTHLKSQLPDYMIPSAFVPLEALPVTSNGKVDRRSLPLPEEHKQEKRSETYSVPTTELQITLSEIWARVLGQKQVGIFDNFFEIGGHSLLAAQLIAEIRSVLQIHIPLRLLFEASTVSDLAIRIEEMTKSATIEESILASEIHSNTLDLQAEVKLDETIRPQEPVKEIGTLPTNIFLTGATGFVGIFLLHELLQHPSTSIYCLVRSTDPELGLKRLQESLESASLWLPTYKHRILPVVGNLEKPLLGLSMDTFAMLAQTIDAIYHCGAITNLAYSYEDTMAANVSGTQEVLRLACQGRTKPLHYVSTLSVFPSVADHGSQIIYEQDELDEHTSHLTNGYEQSKWVAEKIVAIARSRGLPTTVYRLGRISGSSITGFWGNTDMLKILIKGIIQLGSIPVDALEERLEMLPVDYVSHAIVTLASRKPTSGQAFHLFNTTGISVRELLACVDTLGYPVRYVSFDTWVNELTQALQQSRDGILSYLWSIVEQRKEHNNDMSSESPVKIDNQYTLDALSAEGITAPLVDKSVLQKYVVSSLEDV